MNFGMFGNGGLPQMPENIDPKELLKNMTDQQLLQLVKSNPQLTKQYDKIVKQQLSSSTKTKPLTSQQYLSLKGKIDDRLDPQGGIHIQPSPGIVIKGFQQQTGQKVFINVVQHPIVDAPEQKVLVDYENQPGLRIPMSLGRVKEDHDKKGNICKVVDAAMNPQVIEAVRKDNGLLQLLAEILMNYVFEKHKIKLTESKGYLIAEFNVMKEMNYKGTSVEFHRVKGKKAPKIQQVKEENFPVSEEQKNKEEELFEMLSNPKTTKLARPQFKVYTDKSKTIEFDLEYQNLDTLFIEFELPLLIHSRGIHLQVNEEMIYLFVKGIYEIYLRLPIPIGKFKAQFIKNRRVLSIDMERKTVQQAHQSAPTTQKPVNVKIQNDLLYDLV